MRRQVMIPLAIAGGLGALGASVRTGYRWLRRWGATAEEVTANLPGDDLSPDAAVVHTRAVTVGAPAEAVWPWLCQIGQDRSGFFSYTALENLAGCAMPEVHELRPEWSSREVGDRVLMTTPDRYGGKAYNVVAQVHPGKALVLVAPPDPARLERSEPAGWVWQFAVRPGEAAGTSRLVVRSRYLRPQWWLEPIHFAMERRMLLTIARLAERAVASTAPPLLQPTDPGAGNGAGSLLR